MLIVASALFSTGAFASYRGGFEGCSQYPFFQGGLSCNLYCGDGRWASKLNCNDQVGGRDASSYGSVTRL